MLKSSADPRLRPQASSSQKINAEHLSKLEHIAPSVAISLSKLIGELLKANRQLARFDFFLSPWPQALGDEERLRREARHVVGDLLKAEISEKQARSIRYQLTVAKLPLAKDVDDFAFKDTPINEGLVRDLAGGGFIAQQRNVVFVGGTGTGKTHLAIAIARSCIRAGSRGRFFTTVDLVNQLEAESRAGRQGRLADYLTRLDFVIFDELGYLPFAQAGGQLLFHLISRLYERTSIVVTTNLAAQPRPAPPGRPLPSSRSQKRGSILDADLGSKFDAD